MLGEKPAVVFWEVQDPKSTLVASGQLLWFGAQSLLEGHIFRLGSTSSDYRARPRNPPPLAPGGGWALTVKNGLARAKK